MFPKRAGMANREQVMRNIPKRYTYKLHNHMPPHFHNKYCCGK